jgi:hypothetical protein
VSSGFVGVEVGSDVRWPVSGIIDKGAASQRGGSDVERISRERKSLLVGCVVGPKVVGLGDGLDVD